MLELFSYRNFTVTIQYERLDFDCGPSLFKAKASVESPERQQIARLIGKANESAAQACTAIFNEAKREIEFFEQANAKPLKGRCQLYYLNTGRAA